MLREEGREGERKREWGKGGEERWRDKEIDLLDRQFQQDTGDTERGRKGGGEREGGKGGEERWRDEEIDLLDRQVNKTQVILREEWREGERKREGGRRKVER